MTIRIVYNLAMRTVSSERKRLDPVGTRSAILDAATELFCQKGYDGTSMNDIAAKAGVTKSLLQYHFESKDNLWVQAIATGFADFLAHVDEFLASDPTPERLCELMVARFKVFEQHPEVIRMLTWMTMSNAPIPEFAVDRATKLWARVNELALNSKDAQKTLERLLVTLAAIDGWMLMRTAYSKIIRHDFSAPDTNAMFLNALMRMVWNVDLAQTGDSI